MKGAWTGCDPQAGGRCPRQAALAMPRMPGSAWAGWMLCYAHGACEMRDRTEAASELPGAAVWRDVRLPAKAQCRVGQAGKHAEGLEYTMSSIQRPSPLVSIHPLTTPLHHHRAEVTMDVSPAGLHPACIRPASSLLRAPRYGVASPPTEPRMRGLLALTDQRCLASPTVAISLILCPAHTGPSSDPIPSTLAVFSCCVLL